MSINTSYKLHACTDEFRTGTIQMKPRLGEWQDKHVSINEKYCVTLHYILEFQANLVAVNAMS